MERTKAAEKSKSKIIRQYLWSLALVEIKNKRNFFSVLLGLKNRRKMYINIKKLTTALILTGSVQAGHKNGNAVFGQKKMNTHFCPTTL